jgi:hypothetical protein
LLLITLITLISSAAFPPFHKVNPTLLKGLPAFRGGALEEAIDFRFGRSQEEIIGGEELCG